MQISFSALPDSFIHETALISWLLTCIENNGYVVEKIFFNFVDESTLLTINQEYLNHDTHTDIITFDYTQDNAISAEVFISLPRLIDNAEKHKQTIDNELLRLLSHAALHCMGYTDKALEEKELMTFKENEWIELFHVKQ